MHCFQILLTSLLGTATAQQLPEYKYDYDFRPSEGITPTCEAAFEQGSRMRYITCSIWDSKEAGKFEYQRCSDCVLGSYQIQEESKVEYGENFASAVADYIDTCKTTSVDLHILKGTPAATSFSSSIDGSGAQTSPAVTDNSTEVTATPSPEVPVLTPVLTPMPSSASTFAINLISFIVPVLVLANQWRWTQSAKTSSLAQSTTTSSGGVATLMTIRFKDKSQRQKVLQRP
ncbi:hypothetical protein NCS52_00708700 [Fusarium sp. LHS14.1]|nr:hypothetical protein NCS52_00708700 [Fusarium sp. LHS14.1]